MAFKVYDEEKISAIAIKIREKTGGEEKYRTADMPDGVEAVYNAGYEQGISEGGGSGAGEVELTPDIVKAGYCLLGRNYNAGLKVEYVMTESGDGHIVYGYSLPECKQLTLTGVDLCSYYEYSATQGCISFVTGYKDDGGTTVVESHDVVANPSEAQQGDTSVIYTIIVPEGCNVDGIYISCRVGDTPILRVTNLDDSYIVGYEKGYTDGYDAGYAYKSAERPTEGLSFTATSTNINGSSMDDMYALNSICNGDKGSTVVVPCTNADGFPVISVVGATLSGVGKLYLPDTILEIKDRALSCDMYLKYIKFGRYLRKIGMRQLEDEWQTGVTLDFSDYARSEPPQLADASLLVGVEKIIVPSNMLYKFQTDTWFRDYTDIIYPATNE